jgi:hypothetical protein
MKKKLTGAGLALVGALSAAFAVPAHAADPTPNAPAPSESITPTAKAKLPSTYGVVQSVSSSTLVVRLLDGKTVTYSLAEPGAQTTSYSRGDIIGFDTDEQGMAKNVQAPAVERQFEGTVSAIKKDKVTLTSSSGETLTTSISPATIARMGIATGKELTVTQFAKTWATKVCNRAVPAPIPQAVEPTPIPVVPQPPTGGGGFPALPPTPVKGLW